MIFRTKRVLGLGTVMLAAAAAMTMPAQADDKYGFLDDSLEFVDVSYCTGYLEPYDRDYCARPSRASSEPGDITLADDYAQGDEAAEYGDRARADDEEQTDDYDKGYVKGYEEQADDTAEAGDEAEMDDVEADDMAGDMAGDEADDEADDEGDGDDMSDAGDMIEVDELAGD